MLCVVGKEMLTVASCWRQQHGLAAGRGDAGKDKGREYVDGRGRAGCCSRLDKRCSRSAAAVGNPGR